MDAELQALLSMIPALAGKVCSVANLDGGLTNRNYRITTDDAEYVLRIAGANTELLGIDRACEATAARTAWRVHVGPEVVDVLPSQQVLLTRFVQGRILTAEDASCPDMLRRIAETLRQVHGVAAPAGLFPFSPFATVRNYRELAMQKGVPLPDDLDCAFHKLNRIEAALPMDESPCLCHNDLLPSNFIDDGSGIWLIDWEYAGLGDRFFDLGNLAVNFGLDRNQEKALLKAYFGNVSTDRLVRIQRMRLVSDMREAMWGYVQAGISRLHSPAYYMEYARKHLDRFLTGCGNLD